MPNRATLGLDQEVCPAQSVIGQLGLQSIADEIAQHQEYTASLGLSWSSDYSTATPGCGLEKRTSGANRSISRGDHAQGWLGPSAGKRVGLDLESICRERG